MIEHPVSDNDLALYAINGLSNEFKKVSAAFWSKGTPILFEELLKKLMEHASFIRGQESQLADTLITAQAASRFTNQHTGYAFMFKKINNNHFSKFKPFGAIHDNFTQLSFLTPTLSTYKGKCQLCST